MLHALVKILGSGFKDVYHAPRCINTKTSSCALAFKAQSITAGFCKRQPLKIIPSFFKPKKPPLNSDGFLLAGVDTQDVCRNAGA